MDFDPDHPKWQCCCCNLSSGLKILGSMEAFISAMTALVSAINMVQLFQNKEVFGVSIIVKPRPEVRQKGTDLSYQSQMNDTPITLRLIFLLFVMIFVSIGILYTIYLVVRCMRYVTSFRKLLDRRHSFITAGQIGTSFDVAFL
ncbi:hypothetical protein L596_007248 [Steinernema carpocapsae]|uniref:Uncharacterized protein n=1 Tax=Steinernema carpocapsae TaxID=34508 RepID=A0A4U5P8N8_STECR|nr:hypothetical protein L596_007248 [Steinernema carpocapsae]